MAHKLRISGLDPDILKSDFIDYLKNTSEFQNFNPDASGMSSLLDVLAYNAYYQSLMSNFNFNEMFLDTATKRQNVVSRANELGYTPYSKKAAKASLSIDVRNVTSNPSTLILPSGASFSTSIDNDVFNYITLYPYSANIQYDISNTPFYNFIIDVYEGLLSQNTFSLSVDNYVIIPNVDIDISSLRVFVNINGIEQEFYSPESFLDVTPINKVYFVRETFNGYKISFGDGVFGLKPNFDSTVRVVYLVTSGDGTNNSKIFDFSATIPNSPSAIVNVTTITPSSGGSAKESVESIKTNAIGTFKSQDRGVTSSDYKSLIIKASSNIKNIEVWGGQENIPPLFGKVVVCIQPRYGDSLTLSEKSNIQTIISSKSVPNIGLVFKDPQYINVVIETKVTYDIKIITTSVYDLNSLIKSNISNYVDSTLSKFNGKLRYSNMVSIIDRTDPSILNNSTTILLKKKYKPDLFESASISFSFNNALDDVNKSYSMKSTLFFIIGQSSGVWIEDDGKGFLNMFYSKQGVKTFIGYNIGNINYVTGEVYINNLIITGIDGDTIDFIAYPLNQDLVSKNDIIVKLDSNDIKLETIVNK